MNSLQSLLPFLFTLSFSIVGQSLLKRGVSLALAGAKPSALEFSRSYLLPLLLSPFVIGGVLLSGIGVVGWMFVLSRYELGRALPILGGLGYIVLFLVGRVFMKEQTTWLNFSGILCVVLGLYLLSLKPGP